MFGYSRRCLSRGFSDQKNLVFPNRRIAEITSGHNKPGLLMKLLEFYHQNDIDLYSINGKVVEKHPNGMEKCRFDLCFEFSCPQAYRNLEEDLQSKLKVHTKLLQPHVVDWFPIKESDMDMIGSTLQKPGDGLNQDHPGFKDTEYKKRRDLIASKTLGYRMKDPIPRIEYAPEEIKLWSEIYRKARPLHEKFGCKEFKKAISLLEKDGLFSADRIPQLEDMNQYLRAKTNWRIKPVNGILSQREFLNCLAFRTFCSTQYIRHPSKPDYTPEPDIMHEFLGHIPNFADPKICEISQRIGVLSLGASDLMVKIIGAIYWFTIEFGLCREGQEFKFYGAGPGGSFGEIENIERMIREQPANIRRLDIINDPVPVDFVVQDVQPFFYAADSFDDFIDQLDEFARVSPTKFHLRYDNITNSFESDRALILKKPEDSQEGLNF